MKAGAIAMMPSPSETADQSLIAGLLTLRREAYALSARVLGPGQDAEDAVQQAYLEAIRRIGQGFVPARPKAWFLTATLFVARKELRAGARRRKREASVEVQTGVRREPAPEGELLSALGAQMAALDEKHRLPLSLCYEQGLSQDEAAEVLEIPQQTLSRHIGEGLEQLRKALVLAGYAAAPAAVIAGLAHTAPPLPATLSAALEKMVASETTLKTNSAAAAKSAAKGGVAVKVIAGVVLAGALAGGAALLFGPPAARSTSLTALSELSESKGYRPPPTGLSSPPAEIKGPPKIEHYAGTNIYGYLNGPKMGAMGVFSGMCDEQGNLYADCATRCIRASDGMVIRIIGGAPSTGKPLPPEGPACFIDTRGGGGAYGGLGTSVALQGLPLEGGDKGFIYVSSGVDKKTLLKVWKNKEKDGRWWYKEMVKLSSPCYGLQVTKDDKLYVFSRTEVFRYENDKLEKVLDVGKFGLKPGGPAGVGALGIDGDGKTIYFGDNGEPGKIWRIPADLSKAEEYVGGFGWKGGTNRAPDGRLYICGPAKCCYWMCGPWMGPCGGKFLPPDCLFPGSADESDARRIRDGRASTLCKDGEWRELEPGQINQQCLNGYFRGWCPGPNGTAYTFYIAGNEIRVFKLSGIDWNKPTVGPQAKGKE